MKGLLRKKTITKVLGEKNKEDLHFCLVVTSASRNEQRDSARKNEKEKEKC